MLNEYELRTLGSLVEKQIATPDYYPMTLNALVNACNQKNHRDPVVSYDESTVVKALDSLRERKLVYTFHGAESRTVKFGHLFPKAYDLSEPEVAIMCVLILRGPQTPGELRARSGHLHTFENLPVVENLIQDLTQRVPPLALRLPRAPGSRESRYAHLLGGEINVEEIALNSRPEPAAIHSSRESERIATIEQEVDSLKREIEELKNQFANFKSQFD